MWDDLFPFSNKEGLFNLWAGVERDAASRELTAGNYLQAITRFDNAIAIEPDFVWSYLGRGKAYFRLNDYSKSHSDFMHVLRLEPDNIEALSLCGYLYLKLNKDDSALQYLTAALEKKPKHVFAMYYRAIAYHRLRQYKNSVDDLNAILIDAPQTLPAILYRAFSYLGQGDFQRAILDFNTLLDKSPENGFFRVARGHALLIQGHISDAFFDLFLVANFDSPVIINPSKSIREESERLLRQIKEKHPEIYQKQLECLSPSNGDQHRFFAASASAAQVPQTGEEPDPKRLCPS